MSAEVGALREVLPQQPVGGLVRAALPWTGGIAEGDLYACVDLQARVLGHLSALIPGQRSPQLLGQGGDRARDRLTHRVGAMAGERGAVLHARFLAMTCHAGQVQQHGEPRRALHEGSDGRAAETQDEIAFPVSRHRAVGGFRRTLADHDLGREQALPSSARAHSRHTQRPPAPEASRQFAAQRTTALDEQRLVDGLVADGHGAVIRDVDRPLLSDWLRAPGAGPPPVLPPSVPTPLPRHGRTGNQGAAGSNDLTSQALLPIGAQGSVGRKLRGLGSTGRSLRVPWRRRRTVLQAAAAGGGVAPQFAGDCRGRSPDPAGNVLHGAALRSQERDLFAFRKREGAARQRLR